jgi:hypothetical protein
MGSLAPLRHFPQDAIVLAMAEPDLPRYTEPRPSKLGESQVEQIIHSIDTGRTLRDVAAEFGISRERIRQIVQTKRVEVIAAD